MINLPPLDPSTLRMTHSPLINLLHTYELEQDDRLQRVLDIETGNNLTSVFVRDIEWRNRHESNYVLEIKGKRGSGKSTLARAIKALADKIRSKRGSIKDIVWTREEYMNEYKTAKSGQTFIIDEDFGFQTQTGAMRIRESLMLAEQTFRVEEVNTIACSVAHTYSHLYDFYLMAYDYDIKQGVNRAILFNTSQLSGLFARPVGFILFPSVEFLNPTIEKAYKEKKKEFTTKVKQGKVRTLQEDYDRYTDECIIKFGWKQNRPTERMMKIYLRREYPHMANTERDDILDTLVVRMFEIHGSRKKK